MPLILSCSRCHGEMPPMTDEDRAALRSGAGITLLCPTCSGVTAPTPPTGRVFQAHVVITEVVGDDEPEQKVFFDFLAGPLHADDLDAAMPQLAEQLGQRWQRAMEQTGIADSPEVDPRVG